MHRSKRTLKNAVSAVLPANSTMLRAVLAETANPEQGAGNLAGLILNDMGLSVYLFRLINSAFYASSRANIISMRYVVVLLGVENVARAIKKIPVITARGDLNLWLYKYIAARALLASFFARTLAERLSNRWLEPEEARICAMIRPFGLLSLWCAYPDQFGAIYDSTKRQIDLDRFKRLSGWSPSGLGYEVARAWNLPRMMRIVICPDHFNLKRLSKKEALLLTVASWTNSYISGGAGIRKRSWLAKIKSRLEEELDLEWKSFSKMVPGILERFEQQLPEYYTILREERIIEMLPV